MSTLLNPRFLLYTSAGVTAANVFAAFCARGGLGAFGSAISDMYDFFSWALDWFWYLISPNGARGDGKNTYNNAVKLVDDAVKALNNGASTLATALASAVSSLGSAIQSGVSDLTSVGGEYLQYIIAAIFAYGLITNISKR
jgi:hypothetical protein